MATDDNNTGNGPKEAEEQPPPPDPDGQTTGQDPHDPQNPRGEGHDIDVLYYQLAEVRRVLDQLIRQTEAGRYEQRHEYVPVRVSDLMRGFQAAVARANRAVAAGEFEGEDIETMSIKDLRVSLSAPVIDGGHAEDPTLMLPNIKSVDQDTAKLSLEFTVVNTPAKAKE